MLKKFFSIATLLLTLFVAIYYIKEETSFFGRAGGEAANILIDASFLAPVSADIWKNLAQGGEESNPRTLSPVINETKALSPRYIRIDHIYDFYDVVQTGTAGVSYNWSKLDQVIADIRSTGATPFIALSYMPKNISKGNEVDLPLNWNDWSALVKATIEHISGKSGLAIPDVYYEVWNEPDLFGGFITYGEKNYLTLYLHAERGAKAAVNTHNFKFGGPATTALYENWFNSLLTFVDEQKLRLDFISWHKYSKNLSDFDKDILNAKRWFVESGRPLPPVELILTETGPNSENDKVHDESFAALHALAINAALEGKVDKIFTFEIKDGPGDQQFWGRWGILTHEKFGMPFKKPRYNALLFLNKMKGDRLNIAGLGSWVKGFARRDGNIIRIFVVNYDNHSRHHETVPIKIVGLANGSIIWRRIDYGGSTKERKLAVANSEFSVNEYFDPNTAAIFELIFQ